MPCADSLPVRRSAAEAQEFGHFSRMPVHLGLAPEAQNHSLAPGFLCGCSPRPFGTHPIYVSLPSGYGFAGEGRVWVPSWVGENKSRNRLVCPARASTQLRPLECQSGAYWCAAAGTPPMPFTRSRCRGRARHSYSGQRSPGSGPCARRKPLQEIAEHQIETCLPGSRPQPDDDPTADWTLRPSGPVPVSEMRRRHAA